MPRTRKPPKVVILDDEKAVETAIRGRLPREIAARSIAVDPAQIAKLVTDLRRRISARRKRSRAKEPEDLVLDSADIFIVDYDLIKTQGEDYLTGETIAYLARVYSRCGVIVALNQFHRRPTFDLTLKQQLESFADINLSADDLKNSGLWQKGPWKGYRPWSWPILPDLVDRMGQRVQDVERASLRTPILEFLKFPKSAIERLPTSSLEMLGGARSPDKAALGDIISAPLLGLRGKEATQRKSSPALAARIVAARLSAWLNFILAPQDVVVDAAHLCLRCPSLLASTASRKKWNATTELNPTAAIFTNRQLKQARFSKAFWYDRPVWFWTEIEKGRLLPEVKDPWRPSAAGYVFCEDTSSFEKPASSVRFQSDLLSPYRIRHIKRVPPVDYQPAHRLALS